MAAAYAVELDQQAARHYADTGATILLLDVPEATHIAFDHQVGIHICDPAYSFDSQTGSDND